MNKLLLTLSFLIIGLFLLVSAGQSNATQDKVTICHATDSNSHPYVTNQPNKSGDVSGHDGHNGPVWFSGINEKWGDIIPAFTYGNSQSYPGKNLPAGQTILDNNCKIPDEGPSHFACSNNACAIQDGEGENSCNSDSDCAGTPTVTPTPTDTPNNPGNPGGPGDGRSDGGSSCPSCTQAPHSTQAVLGLSTTSSDSNQYVMFAQLFIALVLATAGFKLFQKHA